MKRRHFIASAAAAAAILPSLANAYDGQNYTEGLVTKHLAAGDTVFVDFYTDWCVTCAAQRRKISALVADNPAYEKNIVFIKVDWDLHKKSDLSRRLKIPRRSTLVALKGEQEIGRIVAGTSKTKIKALLDAALGAATS